MRHRRTAPLLALVLIPLLTACEDRGVGGRRGIRDPIGGPSPIPPAVLPLTISYRVTGTIRNTNITYFSSNAGTTQTTSDLPWILAYQTMDAPVFVFLAAEAPLDNMLEGTLVVQIYVDSVLFREARGQGFSPRVSVSGEVTRQ